VSGRIRSLKPEWLEDELLALASVEARLLSVALLLLADDYGNGRANAVLLTGRVFPGKLPEVVEKALGELVSLRYLSLYEVDGQRYFTIRNWSKHQKVDKPGKPRVPGPASLTKQNDSPSDARENIPETPANVLGKDENVFASRDPDPGPDPLPDPDARVGCPRDLDLTSDQRASLDGTPGIPGWAIDVMRADFVAAELADTKKTMTLTQWRKCLSMACTSRWNNSARRPKKPDAEAKAANDETGGYGKLSEWAR
jgi:hypothetical protein